WSATTGSPRSRRSRRPGSGRRPRAPPGPLQIGAVRGRFGTVLLSPPGTLPDPMKTREYEAMFLLDNAAAVADFDGTAGIVDQILARSGATIVQKEKWDERKLAYEI